VETLVGSYSTTVGGTQYAASVEEQGGSYVASVPNVGGATAPGATLIEAENNLAVRIDELV
jgi:predicted RNase H-like HicB family nuclease